MMTASDYIYVAAVSSAIAMGVTLGVILTCRLFNWAPINVTVNLINKVTSDE